MPPSVVSESSSCEQNYGVVDGTVALLSHSESSNAATATHPKSFDIPDSVSYTAQKIMHLLDEIGTSNLVERPIDSNRFLHCSHCSGRLIVL